MYYFLLRTFLGHFQPILAHLFHQKLLIVGEVLFMIWAVETVDALQWFAVIRQNFEAFAVETWLACQQLDSFNHDFFGERFLEIHCGCLAEIPAWRFLLAHKIILLNVSKPRQSFSHRWRGINQVHLRFRHFLATQGFAQVTECRRLWFYLGLEFSRFRRKRAAGFVEVLVET